MAYRITLIRGDGIGPEVVDSAVKCIEATGIKIEWEEVLAGEYALREKGSILPEETINSIRNNRICLKGPITTPIGSGFRSVNVALRQILDLYACVRPVKSYPGARFIHPDIDLVVIRENSEDLYIGIEFEQNSSEAREFLDLIYRFKKKKLHPTTALSIKPISEFASRRISEFAFKYAIENKRKKITVVTKANIMKYTDGLFLNVFREVAKKYADKIIAEEALIDNLCMQLVQKPQSFDILLLPNLYGDIVSDLCAGLVGGLGIAPGMNLGDEIAIFEPVHGSAPKYQGQNKVNPTAMILSGVLMLRYINEEKKAEILEEAVKEVIKEAKFVTYDFKPDRNDPTAVGTKEMTSEIIKKIKEKLR